MDMKNLEELRSALDYYEYVSISDEPNTVYHTIVGLVGNSAPVNTRRILLHKSFFGSRVIDLFDGDVERIEAPEGMEMFVVTNYESRLVLTLYGAKTEKIKLEQHNKLNEHDLVNPSAWNKEMCFYDATSNIAAIGIDMFAFDYTEVQDIHWLRRNLVCRQERFPDYELQHDNAGDCLIPAFIIDNDLITIDIIGGISGRRRTYGRYTPILSTEERETIHSFAEDMKSAYRVLYEPIQTRA